MREAHDPAESKDPYTVLRSQAGGTHRWREHNESCPWTLIEEKPGLPPRSRAPSWEYPEGGGC